MQSRLSYLLSVINKELGQFRPKVTSIEARFFEGVDFLRLTLELEGGFVLEIREVLVEKKVKKYAYYLIKNGKVVVGCDNAPHHRISTFPHHCHHERGVREFTGRLEDFLVEIRKIVS